MQIGWQPAMVTELISRPSLSARVAFGLAALLPDRPDTPLRDAVPYSDIGAAQSMVVLPVGMATAFIAVVAPRLTSARPRPTKTMRLSAFPLVMALRTACRQWQTALSCSLAVAVMVVPAATACLNRLAERRFST